MVLALAEEVDVAERAVGVLGDRAGEHREVAAGDVVDLAVDRPQVIGLPLVADPGVDAVLDAEIGVAEPAIEALGLRRLAELAEVRLDGQGRRQLVARDQPRIDRVAGDAVEQVAVDAQARHQLPARRDVDAEVDVAAQTDRLRAAEQLGRRDVDAAGVDQLVVDRQQRLVAGDARQHVEAGVEGEPSGQPAVDPHPVRQRLVDDADAAERPGGHGLRAGERQRVAAPRGRQRELHVAGDHALVGADHAEELDRGVEVGRQRGVGVLVEHVQRVGRADREHAEPAVVVEVVVDAARVVVVDGGDDALPALGRLRQHEAEEQVDVRPPAGDGDRQVPGDRRAQVAAGVDEVDLGRAVDAVGLRRPELERDGGAVVAAEPRREPAGVEVERVEHLGVEDRRPAEEVEQRWHLVAVDVDPGVVGVGAADQQEAEAERGALDAGQGLDHADRVAERAGHRAQLLALQRAPRDLEDLALALDDGLVGVAAARPHPQPDLERLALAQRDRALEPIEVRIDREHLVAAGRHAVEEERAVVAGHRVEPELGDRDDHAGERAPRAALERGALQRHRRVDRAGVVGRPGVARRWRRWGFRLLAVLDHEVDRRLDGDRCRRTVDLGRLEHVLLGRGDRGLVEAVADRLEHVDRADRAVRGDVDPDLDRGLLAGLEGSRWILRRLRLQELGRPGHHAGRPGRRRRRRWPHLLASRRRAPHRDRRDREEPPTHAKSLSARARRSSATRRDRSSEPACFRRGRRIRQRAAAPDNGDGWSCVQARSAAVARSAQASVVVRQARPRRRSA